MGGDWGRNSGRTICLREKGPSKDAADRLRHNKKGKTDSTGAEENSSLMEEAQGTASLMEEMVSASIPRNLESEVSVSRYSWSCGEDKNKVMLETLRVAATPRSDLK